MMTRQRVGKGSRSNVTQSDLNICTSSSDEHMSCGNWRHSSTVHFSRHLKIHDYLSGIGIPNFDIGIKGRGNKQTSVHRIPNGLRDYELVAMLMLPVHKQDAPVLGYEPGFIFRGILHIEDRSRPIRCAREQVPPLCQINLEGVDGAVVRGRDLLAVGERERGGAARAGEGLEAPRAQLPAFPPLGLLAPHPLWRQTRACMVSVAANGERRWGARPEGERRRTPHGAIGPLPR